jgi:hypothetical protein
MVLGRIPAPLGRAGELRLTALLDYRAEQETSSFPPWEIRTTRYTYWLTERNEREVIVYHWDSDAISPAYGAHLYFGKSLVHPAMPDEARAFAGRLTNARWPTGLVTLPSLLRAVIADLGVEPLVPDRAEVDRILTAAEQTMRASLAWAANP